HKYTIGSVTKSGPEKKLLKEGFQEGKLISSTRTADAIRLLAEDEVDLLVFTVSPCYHVMLQAGINPQDYELVHELGSLDLYIAFNPDTADGVITQFQNALNEIRTPDSNGTIIYNAIVLKYFRPII
ncbi:hypothetical protein OAN24_04915, partial [Pseudodesulfovibrio sp.]|nr:hypothetical protein [Pseudodesulfovibrio sp.]